MRFSTQRLGWATAAIIAVAVSAPARADLVLEYNSVVTGTAPTGLGPWLKVTLSDVGAGSVKMKLENLVHSASEFITHVYFNVDPNLGEDGWSISYVSGQDTSSTPTIKFDNYNGPGSGKFDLDYGYATANNSNRFTSGEISEFLITKTGLSAQSFWYQTNKGEYSVAHVQGIEGAYSGTIRPYAVVKPVPAPAAGLLGMLGLAMVSSRRRRCAA